MNHYSLIKGYISSNLVWCQPTANAPSDVMVGGEVGEPRFGVGQWRRRWRKAVETMGLSWEGDGPKRRWREGESGGREGERGRGRAGGGGERGEGVEKGGEMAGNSKNGGKFETQQNIQPASQQVVLQSRQTGRNRSSSQQARKSTRQGSNLRPGDLQSLAPPLSYWWLAIFGEKTTNKYYSASFNM